MKHIKHTTFYSIIVLGILVFGGFVLAQDRGWFGLERVDKPAQVSVNANQGEDKVDTSDWLTYKDEQMGISFKYPKDFVVRGPIMSCYGAPNDCVVYELDNQIKIRLYKANYEPEYYNPAYSPNYPAGVPVDVSVSPEEIQKYLSSYSLITTPEKLDINNKKFVRFYRAEAASDEGGEYLGFTSRVYLSPLNRNGFGNIEIVDDYSDLGDVVILNDAKDILRWRDAYRNPEVESQRPIESIAQSLVITE